MHEITVPKLNSNDQSYVLVEWLAGDGEELAPDSPVALIETSKTAEELVADEGGILHQAVGVNAECAIGAVIARLFPTEQARADYLACEQRERAAARPATDIVITNSARTAAGELGVDLANLPALGQKVIRRSDIEALAAARLETRPQAHQQAGQDDDVRLSPAQQAVGQVVTRSHQDIPAAFMVIKVPVDAALELQAGLAARSQLIVGLPELLIKAVAGLRERFPLFFAGYLHGGSVSLLPGAHAGITLDLGRGLYIPVIGHADTKSLAEITAILTDFRISALRGSFRESDLSGGNITISLSNDPDILLAKPMIFPGQACILCLCSTQEELFLGAGGEVSVRHYVHLGITYDHRVVNGRDATLFLQELKCMLAEPGRLSRLAGTVEEG